MKEQKEQWGFLKYNKGAEKKLPKNNEHDSTSLDTSPFQGNLLGVSMSEVAREERQARRTTHKNTRKGAKKKKKKGRRKQKETLDAKLDRIFQDNQAETLKDRDNPLWPWFLLIMNSLSFWYYWKYRTIAGLIWFLWAFSTIFIEDERN